MRYGIFSDIHSNLEALKGVLEAYKKEQVDRLLCVGDIVGYGANPKECIDIIRDQNITSVAGNHDWGVTDKFSIDYFNPYAKEAVVWTRKAIDMEDSTYLNNLNLIFDDDDFCLVHGALSSPDSFSYIFSLSEANLSFKHMQASVCFIGHTHVPITFEKEKENISYTKSYDIDIDPDKKYIINVGSVGQPRDNNPDACFSIYDTVEKNVKIKRISYDIKKAQRKIIEFGLPSFLAMRLGIGQ